MFLAVVLRRSFIDIEWYLSVSTAVAQKIPIVALPLDYDAQKQAQGCLHMNEHETVPSWKYRWAYKNVGEFGICITTSEHLCQLWSFQYFDHNGLTRGKT
jgi:hypothetical protein